MAFNPKHIGDRSPAAMHENAPLRANHMENKLRLKKKVGAEGICSKVKRELHFLGGRETFGVNLVSIVLLQCSQTPGYPNQSRQPQRSLGPSEIQFSPP